MIKKKYSNTFMTKNVILTLVLTLSFMLYSADVSAAKPSAKKWTAQCDENKNCMAVIQKKNNEKETVAVMYMQKATYMKDDKKMEGSAFYINLPLNQDLQIRPKVIINDDADNASFDINFTHCDSTNGCVASAILNDKAIKLLKDGEKISIVFKMFSGKDNLQMDFPLKGFTKAYTKILEK